eukprot:CAMPEP_0118800976 /NCGR_PEP_ID=MMETSP1161-20130426/2688_1 /TAXON_ID=249345 /ORGANISM="Picochlorum oklahomensis, Strain CCMP2329" /LENGTH=400 /DNA_ID=CAMNT_0006728855 /DNA_START=650 /DNA_END=1852 /DNA_ORIENTATION=-
MQFSPLKAHASLLYPRDTQIEELGRVFYISSRLIANDIETIEIPFETNISTRREGSIIVRLLPSFPRRRPDVFVLSSSSAERTTTSSPRERRGRQRIAENNDNKEEERIEFAWGEPHIRLVTVVSDIWASLGCVESPRKKAFRQREEENRALNTRLELHSDRNSMDRLGFAFYGQSGTSTEREQGGSRIVSPVRRAQGEDYSLGLGGLALDDDDNDKDPGLRETDSLNVPEIPFDRVESFVRSMSKDAVVAALSSQAEFDRILGDGLGEFGRAEEKRQRVIDIARKNTVLAADVKTLKQQVAIQRSEYDEKMAEFRRKHARQENARAGFGPESLIQQLYMSIDESNRRVSLLVERWKRREISNDVFVREYIEHKSVSHARAMKYQWAKESIPIPIQSNMH